MVLMRQFWVSLRGSDSLMSWHMTRKKVIDILMRDMPEEEAWEYFDFNIAGAFVGELTPIFIMLGSPSCIQELLEPQ